MVTKTISHLDLISQTELSDSDIFEVSHTEVDAYGSQCGYTSKRITFGDLTYQMCEKAILSIQQRFDIPSESEFDIFNNDDGFSVNTLLSVVKAISADPITFYGVKTFDDPPICEQDIDAKTATIQIPNARTVRKMIASYSNAIAPSSMVDFNTLTDSGQTAYDPEHQLIWHIDDDGNDSSKFITFDKTFNKIEAGYLSCQHDGWLVAYGWITDNGSIMPQEAWVGIFGKIKYPNDTNPANETTRQETTVTLLQAFPWQIGQNHSTMQYVSFAIPVQKGLQLKIKTGFKVSSNSSGLHHSNSLMFTGAGSMPNTIVGYIIRNQS